MKSRLERNIKTLSTRDRMTYELLNMAAVKFCCTTRLHDDFFISCYVFERTNMIVKFIIFI